MRCAMAIVLRDAYGQDSPDRTLRARSVWLRDVYGQENPDRTLRACSVWPSSAASSRPPPHAVPTGYTTLLPSSVATRPQLLRPPFG